MPFRLLTLLLCASCLLPASLKADSTLPRHRMALSFDLDNATLHGTSQIVLPASTPLHLTFGPLQVTGAVLEQPGHAPQTPGLATGGALRIPSASQEQTLTLSWQLRAPAHPGADILIGADHITLPGFWHPIADEEMLFSLEAAVPRHLTAVSEADTITATGLGSTTRYVFSFVHPRHALHFIASPFTVRTRQAGAITLATYLSSANQDLAEPLLRRAEELLSRYQRDIGPYPYQRFAIVESPLPVGHSLPTLTLIGRSILRLPFVLEQSLGHELLHSWFGNGVRVSSTSGNWCEGLTTLLADQRFAEEAGRGVLFRKNQLIRFHALTQGEALLALQDFRDPGDTQTGSRANRAVGYDKGAMVLHMLRRHIGETAFNNGIRDFYRRMRGQAAGWSDLQHSFEQISGKELDLFFRQWLERTDLPRLTIEAAKIDQRDGRAVLSFTLVQDAAPPFVLDVPVRVTTLAGTTATVVSTGSTRTTVTLTTSDLPTGLVLDGDHELMRHLGAEERPATWSWFLGAGEKNVLLPAEAARAAYQPLIDLLHGWGCRLIPADQATNRMLGQGSWLFLGDSAPRRTLFAEPVPEKGGFRLEVRPSPLNPEAVMVLADSASLEETAKAAFKLIHYGGASRVRFVQGRNVEQTTTPAANGIALPLFAPPVGLPVQAIQPLARIVDDLVRSRVVYAGETHTAHGDHLLQLQLIQALRARGKQVAIGLEMFPRASQQALDDYIQGRTDEAGFVRASRYFEVWGYDYRLYRDIFQYARANAIPLIGLNLDKGITSRVFADGSTDGLSDAQLAALPPERDVAMPGYHERLRGVYGQHDSPHTAGFGGFVQAQALWDETMAESVVKALDRFPYRLLVVLAGNGHVGKDNGIPPRVARRLGAIAQRVVSGTDSQDLAAAQVDYLLTTEPITARPAGKLGVVLAGETEGTGGSAPGGVRISAISPHGHAGQAGLRAGDLILAVDDVAVADVIALRLALLEKSAGDSVRLTLSRDGERLSVAVELSAPPETGTALPATHPRP